MQPFSITNRKKCLFSLQLEFLGERRCRRRRWPTSAMFQIIVFLSPTSCHFFTKTLLFLYLFIDYSFHYFVLRFTVNVNSSTVTRKTTILLTFERVEKERPNFRSVKCDLGKLLFSSLQIWPDTKCTTYQLMLSCCSKGVILNRGTPKKVKGCRQFLNWTTLY